MFLRTWHFYPNSVISNLSSYVGLKHIGLLFSNLMYPEKIFNNETEYCLGNYNLKSIHNSIGLSELVLTRFYFILAKAQCRTGTAPVALWSLAGQRRQTGPAKLNWIWLEFMGSNQYVGRVCLYRPPGFDTTSTCNWGPVRVRVGVMSYGWGWGRLWNWGHGVLGGKHQCAYCISVCSAPVYISFSICVPKARASLKGKFLLSLIISK